MGAIAIIPARGGSKRLPGKNIKALGGKPLIAWTIEAALHSGCFDRVIVSTDDQAIADVAVAFGAEVPFLRPVELSGDMATSDAVIEHAVNWLEQHEALTIDTVALLQPTSPFRHAEHIKSAVSLMQEKQAEGVVSVTASDIRLELCNTLPADHSLAGFIDISANAAAKRTQDMRQIYELNGAIYLFKRHIVGQLAQLYAPTSKALAYVMPLEDSVDIDTARDFAWAEFCLSTKL